VSHDESPPLSRDDAYRVFTSVLGTKAVLVGGQAIAFWAELYRSQARLPELDEVTEIYVSGDVDFLGGSDEAKACARLLNGKVYIQDQPWESASVSAAQVHFVDGDAYQRKVDFLINMCGVENIEDVRECAASFEVAGQSELLYVMDPVTCLRTRLANIHVLRRTDAKSLGQAQLSVWLAREWLLDRADPNIGGPHDALKRIESVFRFALHHDDAQHAAIEHAIEAFDAIVPHDGLPSKFASLRYPQMREIMTRKRAKLSARRGGGAS
jgi:hypothetical protein